MLRAPSIALWVDDLSMPCERASWEVFRDGSEMLHATFRVELPAARAARDAAARIARIQSTAMVDQDLEAIGQAFEVTRARIRPVSRSALKALRHPSASAKLRAFIDDAPEAPPQKRPRKKR